MSVPMALVDFIPVVLFIISSITLQRCLYDRMSKGAFAVFSAGTVMVCCAGIFKAVWKLLYSMGICDFERLNQAFFPLQSVGFLLAGIAVTGMILSKQNRGKSFTRSPRSRSSAVRSSSSSPLFWVLWVSAAVWRSKADAAEASAPPFASFWHSFSC